MQQGVVGQRLKFFDEMSDSSNHQSSSSFSSLPKTPPPPDLEDMPDVLPDAKTLPHVQYTVQMSTANAKWAGTNKPVCIVLYGDMGQTDVIFLREDDDGNVQTSLRYSTPESFHGATSSEEFPPGSVREFRFQAKPVGNIVKIGVRHDPGDEPSAAWKLDRVVIRNEQLQRSWTFLASRWLSRDNGNHIELKPLQEVSAGRRAGRRASRRLSINKHSKDVHHSEPSLRAERFATMRERFGSADSGGPDHAISKGSESGTRRVCFQLQKFTNTSCHVYLLGGIPALGKWKPERALRMIMHSAADGTWRGEWRLELEIDDDFDDIQYRYIILNEKDSKSKRRIEYPDRLRRFKLSAPDSLGRSTEGGKIYIRDSFGANKFGLPSSSTPSLVLRKSSSRRETVTLPRAEPSIVSVSRRSSTEQFSNPRSIQQATSHALDDASEQAEEVDENDTTPDGVSENGNANSETELSPRREPVSSESIGDNRNDESSIMPPDIDVDDSVTGASIVAPHGSMENPISPREAILREEEAARREWKEQLEASDGQLYKSAHSLVQRQSEILLLKQRNSLEATASPLLIPDSLESQNESSPISSDELSSDERRLTEEERRDIVEQSREEIEKPLIEKCDKLHERVEELEEEQKRKEVLFRKVSEAHDSVSSDLMDISQEMTVRCEEYESQHAELVKLVMDSQDVHQAERKRMELERDEFHKKWSKEFKARRKLFNTLQELRGNIRVFCRVRPLKSRFLEDGSEASLAVNFPDAAVDENSRIEVASKVFEYDHVFHPSTSQKTVYEETSGVVACVLDGYNVCVFAYGQTGSGKTHTMNGPEEDRGVNYRALVDLFDIASEREDFQKIEISVSMMEIYNENLRDLIREGDTSSAPKLEIRKDPHSSSPNAVFVPNLTEVSVGSVDEVWTVMERGSNNRQKGKTNMNEHSSRSHLIFKVSVSCEDFSSGVKTSGNLHLVDLAGSERVGRSNVSGDRLKEAQHINKSLATLGDVFMSLLSGNAHIPYRNSRLTYLLQDSLGGDSKTLMFVNVSCDKADVSETVSSLQFAQRVAKVELGSAKKHSERTTETRAVAALQAKETEVKELNSKIAGLNRELRRRDEVSGDMTKRTRSLEMEVKTLKSKLEEQGRKEQMKRNNSSQELRDLKASNERQQSELRSARQKVKEVTKAKDDEVVRLTNLLRAKDKKIGELTRNSLKQNERRTTGIGTVPRITRPVSTPNMGARKTDRLAAGSRLPRNATFAGRPKPTTLEESKPQKKASPEEADEAEEQDDQNETRKTNLATDDMVVGRSTNPSRRLTDGKLMRSQTMLPPRPQRHTSRSNVTPRPTYAFGRRVDSTKDEANGKVARNVRLPRAPTSLRPAQRIARPSNIKNQGGSSALTRPPAAPRRTGANGLIRGNTAREGTN